MEGREQGWEENGGKGTGIKKHNWQVQNRQGDAKNSIGNGEANELIRTSHGHEPRVGIARRKWGTGQKGQRRKIRDN